VATKLLRPTDVNQAKIAEVGMTESGSFAITENDLSGGDRSRRSPELALFDARLYPNCAVTSHYAFESCWPTLEAGALAQAPTG